MKHPNVFYDLTLMNEDMKVKCESEYFREPKVYKESPLATKSLLFSVVCLNIFALFICGLLLDCGEISTPGNFFFSIMTLYWIYKYDRCRSSKKFPCLTLRQRLLVRLSPIYGFPMFYIIWILMRIYIFCDNSKMF